MERAGQTRERGWRGTGGGLWGRGSTFEVRVFPPRRGSVPRPTRVLRRHPGLKRKIPKQVTGQDELEEQGQEKAECQAEQMGAVKAQQ